MDFTEADRLQWEILRFLWTCPNKGRERPYCIKRIRGIQENIFDALATGQYIILRDSSGNIEHFLCYWKVDIEEVGSISEGVRPLVRNQGDRLYISEHGNKGGRASLTRMIAEIRKREPENKGAFWHSWNRKTFKVFLR